jgi:hypothetical protein
MMRVSANGATIGGIARGPTVEVKVHVESAPWVVVDQVRVLRATAPADIQIKPIVPRPTPAGALAADAVFVVRVHADDALVVIASGTQPMTPVLTSLSSAEVAPWAMTGAIWIDADGDGRALGR